VRPAEPAAIRSALPTLAPATVASPVRGPCELNAGLLIGARRRQSDNVLHPRVPRGVDGGEAELDLPRVGRGQEEQPIHSATGRVHDGLRREIEGNHTHARRHTARQVGFVHSGMETSGAPARWPPPLVRRCQWRQSRQQLAWESRHVGRGEDVDCFTRHATTCTPGQADEQSSFVLDSCLFVPPLVHAGGGPGKIGCGCSMRSRGRGAVVSAMRWRSSATDVLTTVIETLRVRGSVICRSELRGGR
jgi:hypothetical protein